MRRFEDSEGRIWDVVVGRESWGALYALFIPADGEDGGVRQAALDADSYGAAQSMLADLPEHELAELLGRSTSKEG